MLHVKETGISSNRLGLWLLCALVLNCLRYNNNAASLTTVDHKRLCLTDRDECSSSISPCPEQADCENAVGSFRCLCRPGYKGTDSHNSSCAGKKLINQA